ncbi:MAG: NADH-quinone oxidoreductase subunit N [Candidatus Kapabacteria bacterium]|nr:NADH-quinone oxidoreductase subunit N [Candidatus Kapabacteria bacterium]
MAEMQLLLPLISISSFALLAVLSDAFTRKTKEITYYVSLIGLIVTSITAIYAMALPANTSALTNPLDSISKGMVVFGGYTYFFDILFCLSAFMTILASRDYLTKAYTEYKEYYSLILFSVSGMMMIAHAGNLVMIFIGIETMSIPFYILTGFIRNRYRSVESALKYFLLGSFATGFLLYGMAMIYGATGTTDLALIPLKFKELTFNPTYLSIGIGLIIIGLSFKVAAFPFHQWAPDVYEGAPTVITGFMSTAGKAAALVGFIIIARALVPNVYFAAYSSRTAQSVQLVIAIISAATMLIGNISALVQKNIKRMLAYSSIAHAGYLLMGIVANNQHGLNGILFYSAAYLFMQIGAFIIISVLENAKADNLDLDNYKGLYKTHPYLAAMLAMFMFSLAGIPPMGGFFGKYYLFAAAIESGFVWLTIVAVISSIISVYFYIGLVLNMYFKENDGEEFPDVKGAYIISLLIATVGILVIGIYPSILMDIITGLW